MKKADKTELTKEKILNAAFQEFGMKGYEGAKLNTICNDNGISKGLIYHNFENKDDIYLHCVKSVFQNFIDFMKANGEGEGLHAYLKLRFRFFTQNPQAGRIFFEAVLQPPEHLADSIKRLKAEFDEFNLNIYRKEIGRMVLRNGVTEQEAVEYYSIMQEMFNGYYSSNVGNGSGFTDLVAEHETKLGRMLDFMLYGIVKQKG